MFIVQTRTLLSKQYLLRYAKITQLMSSSKESKRKPPTADVPNVKCKKHKTAKLDISTMAQAGGSGNSSGWSGLPTLQIGLVQESIKPKKSKRKSKTPQSSDTRHLCGANMPQFVVNPFFPNHPYIPYLDTRYLTTTTLNHLQLSNVSFNRGDSRTRIDDSTGDTDGEVIGKTARKWEETKLGTILKNKGGGSKPGITFTYMNYNVLAQELLDNHPEIYKQHHRNNLKWEYRWANLLKEIKQHNSDIMCLQEVQESHYEDYYNTNLKQLGYSGIFMKRTGNEYPDGCAIFYKHNVFTLIEHTSVEFNQPNSNLLNRNNVGLIAKFAPIKKPTAHFIIATTHLLYNPRRNDVRLAQVQIFLTEIERFAFTKNPQSPYLPVILSGDFNSLPNSCVVQFVREGIIDYTAIPRKNSRGIPTGNWIPPNLGVTDDCQHIDLITSRLQNINISRTKESELIQIRGKGRSNYAQNTNNSYEHFHTGLLKHTFTFKSIYSNVINAKMEGTTYQDQWVTVDYIFYTGKKDSHNKKQDDKLILLSRYTLPLEQYLSGVHIPGKQLGSDHLSLLAKFKLEF